LTSDHRSLFAACEEETPPPLLLIAMRPSAVIEPERAWQDESLPSVPSLVWHRGRKIRQSEFRREIRERTFFFSASSSTKNFRFEKTIRNVFSSPLSLSSSV